MIERYRRGKFVLHWSDGSKFAAWHHIEMALLRAQEEAGLIPAGTTEAVGRAPIHFDDSAVTTIQEIEKTTRHDTGAFVRYVQQVLQNSGNEGTEAARYYHNIATSFDIVDPALVLLLREACYEILAVLNSAATATEVLAKRHRHTLMIGQSHTQDAQPTTFGHLLLNFAGGFRRCECRLKLILETDLGEAKFAGAVGNFLMVPPEVAALAMRRLGLKLAPAETQILKRDRHARLLNELAVLGGCIEGMAETFSVMMSSRYAELSEPFERGAMGSSAMAHKHNPVLVEQLIGMARMLRGYSQMGNEDIATVECRRIEQNCVERVALPDATTIAYYMLTKVDWLMRELVVHEDRMAENLNSTGGVWHSQAIRNSMVENGMAPERAYLVAQGVCRAAIDNRTSVVEELAKYPASVNQPAASYVNSEVIEQLSQPLELIKHGIDFMFKAYFQQYPDQSN